MSELADKLDLSRFVPQNYPELISYKSSGCPTTTPVKCPSVPCYTKDFFCSQWGKSFKCICPQTRFYRSPYQGVQQEMASLDYFSSLPTVPKKGTFRRGQNTLKYSTMAQRYGLDYVQDCPRVTPSWSTVCPENQKVFNLIRNDTICGICVSPENARSSASTDCIPDCSDGDRLNADDMYDLPFRVKVGPWPQDSGKKPKLPRTGAARCLQPSTFHDLQTVTRDTYRDFRKLKTRSELQFYQTPLAIDTRRPPLKIPSNPRQDLILSGPISVNALPILMRPKGPQKLPRNLGPKFEVIVQGPICI